MNIWKVLKSPWFIHGLIGALVMSMCVAVLLESGYSFLGAAAITLVFLAFSFLTVKARCGRIF